MKFRKFIPLIVFSALTLNLYATPDIPHHVHHPLRIKPNTDLRYPSGISPSQMQTAYGFSLVPSKGYGQTIAIVDAYDHPNIESDLAIFSSTFGLPQCSSANGCFQKVYAQGSKPETEPSWAGEIALDVEWAHAIAPEARILLVEARDSGYDALMPAIDVAVQYGATVVSLSWGSTEWSSETSFDSHFNVGTVSFTTSSGDWGHAPQYPAASPYVLAVGGTTLSIDSYGNYISEKAWSGSGGGLSYYESEPSYQINLPIPEAQYKRGIPDVSYDADPNTGVSVYNSVPNAQGQTGWFVMGGTSASAPQWAALIAIANASVGFNFKVTNELIYAAANSSQYNWNYYDIISGNNGSCGFYCNTAVGYDYVTGLGSPRVPNLINFLISHFGLNNASS